MAHSHPLIPALNDFVERSLTTILKANSDHAFNTAFDAFFSKELKEFTLNGKKLNREEYQKQLREAAEAGSTVSFPGIVSADTHTTEDGFETGLVGAFVRSAHIKEEHGETINRTLFASINLSVKVDESLRHPTFEEKRRVFSVDQVSLEQTGRISPK